MLRYLDNKVIALVYGCCMVGCSMSTFKTVHSFQLTSFAKKFVKIQRRQNEDTSVRYPLVEVPRGVTKFTIVFWGNYNKNTYVFLFSVGNYFIFKLVVFCRTVCEEEKNCSRWHLLHCVQGACNMAAGNE